MTQLQPGRAANLIVNVGPIPEHLWPRIIGNPTTLTTLVSNFYTAASGVTLGGDPACRDRSGRLAVESMPSYEAWYEAKQEQLIASGSSSLEGEAITGRFDALFSIEGRVTRVELIPDYNGSRTGDWRMTVKVQGLAYRLSPPDDGTVIAGSLPRRT